MSGEPVLASSVDTEPDPLASPFIVTLIRVMRAHDAHHVWAKKSDTELLAPYVVTKEQRRKIPIIADPDSRVVWRVEQFYSAIGLSVEQSAGIIAAPMVKLSSEGFGRVLLTAGRLVVLARNLRDIHRFGFESLADLAKEGSRLTSEAVAMIEKYPEVAKL
jgi:probable nitrogen fixation protein